MIDNKLLNEQPINMCAYNWPGPYPPRRSVIVRAGERDSAGPVNKRVTRSRKHAVSPSTAHSQPRSKNTTESPPDSRLSHLIVSSPSSSSSSPPLLSSSSSNSIQSSSWSSIGMPSECISRSEPTFPSSSVVEAPQANSYQLDGCFPFNNENTADEEMRLINSVCRIAPYGHHHEDHACMDVEYIRQSNQHRCHKPESSSFRFCEAGQDHRVKTTVIAATSSYGSGGVVHQQVRERSSSVNWPLSYNPSMVGAQTIESMDPMLHKESMKLREHQQQAAYNEEVDGEEEFHDLADVHQADSDGDLLIHIAVAKENELQVSQLIHLMTSSNRSLDVYNKMKQTPLHVATMTGHLNILRRLLSAGCSPRLPDRHGNSALHLAVRSSSLACVNVLLECPSSAAALHQRNYNGFMPLHLAVFRRDTDLVGLLVAKGAECNVVDGTSGRTPLYHATLNGHEDVVRKLINLGASVNIANFAGVTPLVVATDRRLKSITSLLISRGATISARDDNT